MALHLTPEDHDADTPNKWTIRKADKYGKRWNLCSSLGDGSGVLDTFPTKFEAERGRYVGRIAELYLKEGRWFRGESIPGWKPYADCKAGRDALATR